MEGSRPAQPAEPGTLKATLMDLPGIDKMTEKETAHPSQRQLDKLTRAGPGAALFSTGMGDGDGVTEQKQKQEQENSSEEERRRSLATNLAQLSRQESFPVSL